MTTWERAATLFQASDAEFEAWTKDQEAAHELWATIENKRMLLFYPTGKGKTKTSLGLVADAGFTKVMVIAPPKTHSAWKKDSIALDLELTIMSVEKFRMKETKAKRNAALIVDEFHLLGKHGATGFKKLDRLAAGFPAIILASATPNYNDADRAYCIAHVLDPIGNLGGYQAWIIKHCETRLNPFATTPYIDGFLAFDGAAEWLVDKGYTAYIEDDAVWTEEEFDLPTHSDEWFENYNYDKFAHKMIASDMEKRHRRTYLDRVNPATGYLWNDVRLALEYQLDKRTLPWLVFCQHATIADAVARSLIDTQWASFLITGSQTHLQSEKIKKYFIEFDDRRKVLVGTSTLATGVDGLDKVCDQLLIFDDIDGDHSKRRQLIGRVLDRGLSSRATKVVYARTE